MIAWPPLRLHDDVQQAIDAAVSAASAAGVEPSHYRRTWIEALTLWLREQPILARHRTDAEGQKIPVHARPSNLVGKAALLLQHFIQTATPAFSWAQAQIARRFGLGVKSKAQRRSPDGRLVDAPGVRQVREVMRILEGVGFLRVIRRFREPDHEAGEESRANIYIATIPRAALEAWKRVRGRLARSFVAPSSEAPPASSARPRTGHRAPAAGAGAEPPTLPRPRIAPATRSQLPASWWLPLARAARRKRYPSEPDGHPCNTIRDPAILLRIESTIEDEAGRCRAFCEQAGLPVPPIGEIRATLGIRSFEQWLDDPENNARHKQHPIAFFGKDDVGKLIGPTGKAWRREHARAHRRSEPTPVPELVRPAPGPSRLGPVVEAAQRAHELMRGPEWMRLVHEEQLRNAAVPRDHAGDGGDARAASPELYAGREDADDGRSDELDTPADERGPP